MSIVAGQLISGVINATTDELSGGWRLALGLAAVPSALMLCCWLLLLPESPRWLAQRRRHAEAAAVLAAWDRGGGGGGGGASEEAARALASAIAAESGAGGAPSEKTAAAAAEGEAPSPVSAEASVRVPEAGLCAAAARCAGQLAAIWREAALRRAALLGISLMAINQLSG